MTFKAAFRERYLSWYYANITLLKEDFPYTTIKADYGPWTRFADLTDPGDSNDSVSPARQAALDDLALRIQQMPDQKRLFIGSWNHGYELQADCVPYAMRTTAWNMLGTVIFFHGYTACSQQGRDLARLLVEAGYNVVVPLLPGQGRAPIPRLKTAVGRPAGTVFTDISSSMIAAQNEIANMAAYYSDYLPSGVDGKNQYIALVRLMNELMELAPGPSKSTVGLSVGGAMALLAPFEKGGELYDRSLIISPYLSNAGRYAGQEGAQRGGRRDAWSAVIRTAEHKFNEIYANSEYHSLKEIAKWAAGTENAPFANRTVSWGGGCYAENSGLFSLSDEAASEIPHRYYVSRDVIKLGGRNGICDFKMKNGVSINAFGEYVTRMVKEHASSVIKRTKFQFVAIANDASADTGELKWNAYAPLLEAEDTYRPTEGIPLLGRNVQLCFYSSYVNSSGATEKLQHSFFSPQDNLGLSREWIPFFLKQSVDFLTRDRAFFNLASGLDEFERTWDKKRVYAACKASAQ